jgi:hypothetical protein
VLARGPVLTIDSQRVGGDNKLEMTALAHRHHHHHHGTYVSAEVFG